MKYILDLKDYVTKIDSELKDMNECFYRYNIVDNNDNILAQVWFTQMQDSGNIYSAYCRIKTPKLNGFNIWINVPMDGPYTPSGYDIELKNHYINEHNFYNISNGLEMARNIARCIMSIFGSKEHIEWKTK